MELISVIIPIYNVEKFLRRCVDSVLMQTYKNIEVILVDDGSPDNCGEICDEYAKKDIRVKVIHKKNGGISDARNKGIECAKGQYLTFLDSDDWISNVYLERLYNLMKTYDADITVCNFVRTTGSHDSQANLNKRNIFLMSNREAISALFTEIFVQMTIACGKLYNKEIFDDLRFPIGKVHEDESTTYKALFRAKKVVYTEEVLLYYWQHPNSMMGAAPKLKNKLNLLEAFEERLQFLIDNRFVEEAFLIQKMILFFYRNIDNTLAEFEDKHLYLSDFKTRKHKFLSNYPTKNVDLKTKLIFKLYKTSPSLFRGMHYFYMLIKSGMATLLNNYFKGNLKA